MEHHSLELQITCHRAIETPQDAAYVLHKCLIGELRLVSRGPTNEEARQLIENQAVFVYPFSWIDETPQPGFNGLVSSPILTSNGYRSNLWRSCVALMHKGQPYHIEVIFRTQPFIY